MTLTNLFTFRRSTSHNLDALLMDVAPRSTRATAFRTLVKFDKGGFGADLVEGGITSVKFH